MFKNSSKLLFMMILITGTMITISANSWFSAWMGLEINLLAFVPLMINHKNLMSTEASLKYFLTQALASAVLLFSVISLMLKFNLFLPEFISYPATTILLSLLLKSGAAPLHFWFPMVMEGLSWINGLILMTWQKIAPLMLISYIIIKPIILMAIIASSVLGTLGGLNQTSLRKLMAFSSINHLSWMITAMMSNETLWLTYFMFYSLLTSITVITFSIFKLIFINQLFIKSFNSTTMKFCLFINLLSLGGLPPFLGFMPKWLVIQYLSTNNQLFLLTLLTAFTLIALFFYMRLCYTAFMLNSSESNWPLLINFNKPFMTYNLLLTFISLSGLLLVTELFNNL